jgi:chorismate mutase
VTGPEQLEGIRERLDELDRALVELLGRRVHLARKAAAVKREAGMPMHDPERERQVRNRAHLIARIAEVDAAGVERVMGEVIALCRAAQGEGEDAT